MIDVDRLVALTKQKIGNLEWGTGAQVVVLHGDATLADIAFGSGGCGHKIDPDSMFAIYCATKPLVTLAIAELIDRQELSLDDQLGHILTEPLHPALAALTIESLLTHRAGLHQRSTDYLLNPATIRNHLVRQTVPLNIDEPDRGIYSEYVAWHLLGAAIEALTSAPFDVFTTDVLQRSYGAHEIAFRPSRSQTDRLRLNADMTMPGLTPLYWEAAPSNLRDARAAQGGYASMRQLAILLHAVSDRLPASPTLQRMLSIHTKSYPDPILDRTVAHGCGFMVNGHQHYLPGLGVDALGHTGLGAMTTIFTSPEQQLTLALHTTGLTTNALERRAQLAHAMAGATA